MKKKILDFIEKIPSQKGKTIIITGTSGLAFNIAEILCKKRAVVVLAGRNENKGFESIKTIRESNPKAIISYEPVDLGDLRTVTQFINKMNVKYPVIDVLINNAGVMNLDKKKYTKDGLEIHYQTNFLSHYYITNGLIENLKNSKDGRVISLSSVAGYNKKLHFNDFYFDKRFRAYYAYGCSKLEAFMITKYHQEKYKNTNVKFLVAHPGISSTNLFSGFTGFKYKFFRFFLKLPIFAQSSLMGSLNIAYAATATDVKNGDSYGPKGLFHLKGFPTKVRYPRFSKNKVHQEMLVKLSNSTLATNLITIV
ncbi:MAG: SDR family NAD(P)-dependent oxidoreductase [Acholeplasmatales bacterium]|jgi:NAD(P)-dependent dehydrogenase (short-subunit alcohol dehydrogenase family)|nr:SDR family NAD(P)-dependent oxidoreductase [Acholeplasmatales bacterium]